MPTALITGASAGLGEEFARQLAAKNTDLVLVARNEGPLRELAEELTRSYGIKTEVLTADLTDDDDIEKVADYIKEHRIDTLINNAGFGLPLTFDKNDIDDEVDHMRIHIEAPMVLSHAALNSMKQNGGGTVILVASMAAFIPRSTYAASKQWMVMFARWANPYYAKDNITVTAVCPGFTHTSFHERMGLPPGEEGIANWMWLDAPDVVREGLQDAAKGKAVSIPSRRYKVLATLSKYLPSRIGAKMGKRGRV